MVFFKFWIFWFWLVLGEKIVSLFKNLMDGKVMCKLLIIGVWYLGNGCLEFIVNLFLVKSFNMLEVMFMKNIDYFLC